MPVYMNPSELYVKNPNGNGYLPQNTVSQHSVEDVQAAGASQVSAVNSAGATQVAAINTKAGEVTAQLANAGEMEDMVAGAFSTSKAYKAGDYVIYTTNNVNKLYRFNVDHAAGAWNSAQVSEVKLGDETSSLKSAFDESLFEVGLLAYPGVHKNGHVLFTSSQIPAGTKIFYKFTAVEGKSGYLDILDSNNTRIKFIGKGSGASGDLTYEGEYILPSNYASVVVKATEYITIDYIRTYLSNDRICNELGKKTDKYVLLQTQTNTANWSPNGAVHTCNRQNKTNKIFIIVKSNSNENTSLTTRGVNVNTYSGNYVTMTKANVDGIQYYYGVITQQNDETVYWITNGAATISSVTSTMYAFSVPDDFSVSTIIDDYLKATKGNIGGFIADDKSIEFLLKIIKGNEPGSIVCWGDSLTAGVGATTSGGFVALLNSQLSTDDYDYSAVNRGVSGDGAQNVMFRQGAIPIYIKPFTMSARSGSNIRDNIEFYPTQFGNVNFQFPYDLNYGIRPCYLNGVRYGDSGVAVSDGQYQWLRTQDGSAVSFTRPVLLTYDNQKLNDQITVIWIGTNNIGIDVDYLIQMQKAMVDFLKTDRYVIIGLTCDIRFPQIDTMNTEMARYWGRKFLDVKKYLIEFGLADNNLTPTEEDEQDIANNIIPRTLLGTDEIHFREYGYVAIKNCLYHYLINEKYISK